MVNDKNRLKHFGILRKGYKCVCKERYDRVRNEHGDWVNKPILERNWKVIKYRYQNSTWYKGGGKDNIPSKQSTMFCDSCGAEWRAHGREVEAIYRRDNPETEQHGIRQERSVDDLRRTG